MQTYDEGPGGYRPPAPVNLKTPQEAASILRVSLHTLYTLIYERQLKAIKVGRQWRIDDRTISEFVGESGEVRR